jgi:hypothetical protein
MITLPIACFECPLARHLYNNRFVCGNSLTGVVRSHYTATAECHEAVLNHPEKYFQPLILPDLQGLDPELICNYIKLGLNWLDVYPDEGAVRDGENAIEVSYQDARLGYIKSRGDKYYCNRIAGLESLDPYWIALHMVHPDYLYQIVDEMIIQRSLAPDYT